MISHWTSRKISEQSGRVAIITGANSGTGFEAAKVLFSKGATVVMACRSMAKGEVAMAEVKAGSGDGQVELMHLDLADLDSVREFAEAFNARFDRLDMLLNNAGIMAVPEGKTAQGHELQFGTNHLGHFVLTALLLERLKATAGSRVVTMSSIAHRQSRIDVEDLNWDRRAYNKATAYADSKLANIAFGFELHRRLTAAGLDISSIVAHPGIAKTSIFDSEASGVGADVMAGAVAFGLSMFAQSAARGALPLLFAATDPSAEAGSYYGPRDAMESRGNPAKATASRRARDSQLGESLWWQSEALSGVSFAF